MSIVIFFDIIMMGAGVIGTCIALAHWRKELIKLEIKVNFMEVREEHRQEELLQYKREVWRLREDVINYRGHHAKN